MKLTVAHEFCLSTSTSSKKAVAGLLIETKNESHLLCLYLVVFLFPFLELGPITIHAQCLRDQQLSLLEIKTSLVFDHNLSTNLVTWNSSTECCAWRGVTCTGGRVTGLNLSMESISGELDNSAGLFNLKFLQNLDLSFNNFNTTLPAMFGNLTGLVYLNLSNAGFSGQIPIQISKLSNLVSLDLSMTTIYLFEDGVAPLTFANPNLATIIRNFTQLRQLHLDGIDISVENVFDVKIRPSL